MKFRHIIVPDIQRIGGSRQRVGTARRVKSNPHAGGVVSCIAHKPSVNIVVGGSGLSGAGHIGQCFSMGGSMGTKAMTAAVTMRIICSQNLSVAIQR